MMIRDGVEVFYGKARAMDDDLTAPSQICSVTVLKIKDGTMVHALSADSALEDDEYRIAMAIMQGSVDHLR